MTDNPPSQSKPASSERNHRYFVSQMYSTTLTKRCHEAVKVRKDLKRIESNIQAYVKFPAQLMIKREKTESTAYLLSISFLYFFKPKAVYT